MNKGSNESEEFNVINISRENVLEKSRGLKVDILPGAESFDVYVFKKMAAVEENALVYDFQNSLDYTWSSLGITWQV